MARWPHDRRATWITAILIFVVLPVCCALAAMWIRGG